MNRKHWTLTPMFILFSILLFGMSFISIRYNPYLAIAEFGVSFLSLVLVVILNIRFRTYIRRLSKQAVNKMTDINKVYHERFSFPVLVVGPENDIIWCNSRFVTDICDGRDPVGTKCSYYTSNKDTHEFFGNEPVKIQLGEKFFRVYGNPAKESTILYYIDDTYYRSIEREFRNKKATVALAVFDNADDFDSDSDGETEGEILLAVDRVVQKWASDNSALCCKLSSTRYMLVFEERILREFISSKFPVLEEVRQIKLDNKSATLSIGIGRGKNTLRECELDARKALEMALGRGGDQVALSVDGDYEFFGGVSKGVEKRSKVKTRTFANNIKNIIKESGNVILMGHRYSDLDCIGAAVGLYSTITKTFNKEAHIVCDFSNSLAKPLIDECIQSGMKNAFVSPANALSKVNDDTLLIILDTHISTFIESVDVYNKCSKVIIIDHHRKMTNFISDAIVFFHEPMASSACEMVTELLGYLGDNYLSRFEAEALLSGIMLDTKNFVIKTGVRTFEAAAYLKQKGADTINVKRLFAGDIDEYKNKSLIISKAKIFDNNAISFAEENTENVRVIASQAADELLGVMGVHASYVFYRVDKETIGISARSYGKVNVQLIMEQLGGGGHFTMAACQIKTDDYSKACDMLIDAIDKYNIGR